MNKINEFNILFVNLQLLFTIIVVVLLILSFFINVGFWLELSLCFALSIMAYNNYKIYKKKKLTIVYISFAIIMFILFLLMLLGVV